VSDIDKRLGVQHNGHSWHPNNQLAVAATAVRPRSRQAAGVSDIIQSRERNKSTLAFGRHFSYMQPQHWLEPVFFHGLCWTTSRL
jgi:hypothetical protein